MRLDNVGVVIPAAGQGKRMGASLNKQFLALRGIPLLAHTVSVFQSSDQVREIVIVGAKDDIPVIEEIVESYRLDKVAAVPIGGAVRQESVFAGVQALSAATQRVVVHDGARPLLTLELFHRFLAEAEETVAAITAVPLKDTVKLVNQEGWVVETPPREQLRAVQTPQVFERAVLEEAHRRAAQTGFIGTDDASLVEWLGYPVKVLEGSAENIKITTPDDLWLAEKILAARTGTK